jgi:hypothetical protein
LHLINHLMLAGGGAEQSSQPSGTSEDSGHALQSSGGGDESPAGSLWRPSIRQADAADDPRWQLEIGILSSERDGQQVLEVSLQTCWGFQAQGRWSQPVRHARSAAKVFGTLVWLLLAAGLGGV